MLFCRIPFSRCSSHFQYKLFQLWGTAVWEGCTFFKPYVWIKSGTVAFWALEKTSPLITRKSSCSSLLCLAVWTNVTPKEWKCSHIFLQIQDFNISKYAIDGRSQSILFSPEEPFADKALCHSVTYFPDFSHSMTAAVWLLFVPMQNPVLTWSKKDAACKEKLLTATSEKTKPLLTLCICINVTLRLHFNKQRYFLPAKYLGLGHSGNYDRC